MRHNLQRTNSCDAPILVFDVFHSLIVKQRRCIVRTHALRSSAWPRGSHTRSLPLLLLCPFACIASLCHGHGSPLGLDSGESPRRPLPVYQRSSARSRILQSLLSESGLCLAAQLEHPTRRDWSRISGHGAGSKFAFRYIDACGAVEKRVHLSYVRALSPTSKLVLLNTIDLICRLELKTLIFSDGYVPRKDKGTIHTQSLLANLGMARNLVTLDVQRLELADDDQVERLAEVLEGMGDLLEEVRITGIFVGDTVTTIDPVVEVCTNMGALKTLAFGTNPGSHPQSRRCFISNDVLRDLCTESTTLQDLTLRALHLDDDTMATVASALSSNSFLTSLDLRQNQRMTRVGYNAVLHALERNFELWCSVNVDNLFFQGRFSAIIELNQAGRGDLLRSPSREKFIAFMERIAHDPSAIWYFLSVHDEIRDALVNFMIMKETREVARKKRRTV